jgi:hypothetical protein
VEELVRASNNKQYELSSSELPLPVGQSENCGVSFYVVSESTYAAPILVTDETKEQFATLRHEIEESGVPLHSPEQLTREIEGMRSRR